MGVRALFLGCQSSSFLLRSLNDSFVFIITNRFYAFFLMYANKTNDYSVIFIDTKKCYTHNDRSVWPQSGSF
jgi:hypothetical protein